MAKQIYTCTVYREMYAFFLKPFLIFCHWEKKQQQKNLKKTKKAKKKNQKTCSNQ